MTARTLAERESAFLAGKRESATLALTGGFGPGNVSTGVVYQSAASSVGRPLSDWLADTVKSRTLIVAGRGKTPTTVKGGGSGDSDNTNGDSRIPVRNGLATASNIRLVFGNFATSSGVEVDGDNDITVRAALELHSGSAFVTKPVTFNGATSVTIDPAAGLIVSDPVGITLYPGQLFFVRCNVQVTAEDTWPAPGLNHGGDVLAGDVPQTGVGGNMVSNTSATVVNDTGFFAGTATNGFCHAAVLGTVATYAPAVVIFGDSIDNASGDSTTTNLVLGMSAGIPSRGMRLSDDRIIPSSLLAVSGTNFSHIGSADSLGGLDNYRRWSMLDWATHAYFGYGTNDIAGGRTLAQLQASATNSWKKAKQRGLKVAQRLILPRTTSSDSWVTGANQTPVSGFEVGGVRDQFNAWILTQVGTTIDYVIDVNQYLEDPEVPGAWISTGGTARTDDGVHPNATGHSAGAAAVSAWAEIIAAGG